MAVFAQDQSRIINNNESINFTYLKQELENQWVSSMIQDNEGFMWFTTQDGLYKYDGYRFFSYKYMPHNEDSLPANWARFISQDSKGIFWLATQGEGLVKFDQKKNTFKKIISNQSNGIKSTIAYSTFVTSKDAIWLIGDDGLFRKSVKDSVFVKIKAKFKNAFISETSHNEEIVAIDDTIYRFKPTTKKLEIANTDTPLGRLSVNSKDELIYRHNGIVYSKKIGQKSKSLNLPESILLISNVQNDKCIFFGKDHMYKYDFNTHQAEILNFDTNTIDLSTINSLYLDNQDILWIATRKGLYKENKAGNVFLNTVDVHARRIIDVNNALYVGGRNGLYYHSKENNVNKLIIRNPIFSLLKTREGIWAGDMYGSVHFIDSEHKVTSYKLEKDSKTFLKLYGLVRDSNGFIWVSSWKGLYLLNKNGEVIKKFLFDKDNAMQAMQELKIIQLHLDTKGNLWVLTIGDGLFVVPKLADISVNKTTFNYKHYNHIKGDESSLNSNVLYEIHEDNNGHIWIGSDFGINKYLPQKESFEILKIRNTYFDKKVMAIETDSNNLLWITTITDGIFIYNDSDDSLINLRETDGLLSNACLFTSGYYNGNELYFGTDKGIQVINPKNIIKPNIDKAPVITNINILGDEPIQNNVSILNNQTLYLKHNQTDFSLDFSLHDYRFPEKINYHYILENSHSDWREASNNRVSYTNLKPGIYEFKLKASYQSEANTPIAKLTLDISSPWYKTTLAYVLFSLALASLVFLFFQLRYRQKVSSNKLKVAEEIDRVKSNLFTNISHELRTPLTLISGPVEHQLSKKDLKDDDREELTLVKQNADRLLNLVNQLMDLALIDSGQLKLRVAKANLRMLLEQSVTVFKYQADKKNIKIQASISKLESVWFDKDSIEKIVFNLLSNAIKYSDISSTIIFEAKQQNDALVLLVINQNRAASNKDLAQMFERFYQNDASAEGVGVGLALVRELVALNNGTIIANTIDPDKIQFSVTLPINKSVFSSAQIQEESIYNSQTEIPSALKDDKVLLIVEDDNSIRKFICSIFKNNFKIIEAINGEIGLAMAQEFIPDLIISDVMMPVLDGVALCNQLKNNQITSHIPIILLTARVGEEHEITGLKTGADAYITKPFHVDKLKVRVDKLLEGRAQLQKHYSKGVTISPDLKLTSTETEFLERLQSIVTKELTNSQFTSERFAEVMLMSRTQLHRKLKAIFNLSTTEFIRKERLKLAIQLLKDSDATVAEIAYQVGFNSPSYFIKCFKDIYNCTPNEYVASKK